MNRQYQEAVSESCDRIVVIRDQECFCYSRSAWDELFGTYRKERALMQEWENQWKIRHSEYGYFNADGIVDYDRWSTIPEGKRILVVLKETNGLEGDLASFFRFGGGRTYYRTWNNVARWINMIPS